MTTKLTNDWQTNLPEAFETYRAGRRIEEVECVVPDLAGSSRGKAMPSYKFAPKNPLFLPISIFYQTITGEDVDMDIDNQWAESDMVLRPDMSTATAVPWASDVTLQVINDLQTQQGEPVEFAPRNVLKRVIKAYQAKGWKPVVAPELEFYLIAPNVDPNEPIRPSESRTGRQRTGRQSYSMTAVDDYGPVLDTIYDYAKDMGLPIDTVTQEDGAGQLEINLPHGDPLLLADQVFQFKRLVREAALKHGIFATFMAKPMRDEPGSAMHLHQSIVDAKTAKNIFSQADGQPTPAFYHYIAGSQKYLNQAMLLLAPYVNSYRRFESDTNSSAPTNLEWGFDNRACGLRIPNSTSEARRVENRIIGVDCNPYLAFAASLACGYLGLTKELQPTEPLLGEASEDTEGLPLSLGETLNLFEESTDIREQIGVDFCSLYEAIKDQELSQFQREISPWEREHLLLNV